ncbi:hypothetical protein AVEN_178028-1 [Araneus ventricosus]|uniref:Uncharacterized protein n=1 Tax=Araneus ventricosus TaxID=182803 RepID=A0A4Y2P4Y1_ARAVE|nr:hypothetical protein AVEN_178028-1 [Araneus ventricosus]
MSWHPPPNFRAAPAGGHLAPADLACTRPASMAILRWNRVSDLAPSGPEVESLPLGYAAASEGWMIQLKFSLVELTSSLEATRRLFWDGLHHFEPWSC